MKRLLFATSVIILAVAGCQDRHFMSADSRPSGEKVVIPKESIQGFAKEYGLSEAEAAEYFRNGQSFPKKSQQVATDPPVDSGVRRTSFTETVSPSEPIGEATASDASSGSLEPPQSDLGPSMIRTTGRFGAKTY